MSINARTLARTIPSKPFSILFSSISLFGIYIQFFFLYVLLLQQAEARVAARGRKSILGKGIFLNKYYLPSISR